MAVFDKKVPKKVILDDTEALTVTIENAQNVNGHTEYVLRVQRGPQPEKSWLICKRFSDFVVLHSLVQLSGINIQLPPKKLIGNMDRNFVARRQSELQNYLNLLLMNPILASSLGVRRFLDPHNYVVSLQELALQHVSMALRSEINYELIKPVAEMGWRLRKHYFLVRSKLKQKSEMLLQWVEFGPDKYLEDRDLQNVLKCLVNLNHPHIEKLEYIHCGEGGCFTVRQLYQCGTLRDIIYGTKPKSPFLKKYGNPKQSKPLSLNDVSLYGRQIIETLIFLHEKGIPYGHLHLGNIVVMDNNIRLLDIENAIIGLPSYYRPFFVQHKRINSMEAIDVYNLGQVLFEMIFGYQLHESVCDNIPPTCPPTLRIVLESILSSERCKGGLPTLQELLQHPFFSMSCRNQSAKVTFKLTSSIKQSLKSAIESTEKRLQDEQKVIRHQKKITRMQQLLTSEEDMNKKKQRLKEDKSVIQKQPKVNNTNNASSMNSTNISNNTSSYINSESLNTTNGKKSPPRSDSLTSTSTTTSAGTMTPPLPATKIPPACSINNSTGMDGRSALLDSICAFDKSVLRHRPTTVNGSA